jgi:hypothetical protein
VQTLWRKWKPDSSSWSRVLSQTGELDAASKQRFDDKWTTAIAQIAAVPRRRGQWAISDPLRMWAKKLIENKPFKLVAVALANKMARIAFAIMRGRTVYREISA